jgi:hypothetical protein
MDERVIKSFEGFLSFTVGISIFGASIFTVIVSEIADPTGLSANARFGLKTVRAFLAISWLLFVLALGIGGFSMSVLAYARENTSATGSDVERIREWEPLGLLASSIIQALIIGAFLFLSLVVVAYTGAVGWVAVALTSAIATLALVNLAIQWV